MMILAQIFDPELVDSIRSLIVDIGFPAAVTFAIIWLVSQQNKNANQQNKNTYQQNETINDLVRSVKADKEEVEKQLDSTQQMFDSERKAFESERKAWEAERKTFLAERDRLIKELERSTNSEAEMGDKIKELTGDYEKLRIRINDLDAERKADKLEKEQILRDAKLTQKELATATKEKKKLEDERSLLERMLSENKDALNDLRERVARLEKAVEFKDHQLSEAYGTISELTRNLAKLTDDTQKIPPFEDIENAGNDDEVITPVVNMELNFQETEDTTIVIPEDSTSDNDNEDNDKKDAA